MEIGKICAAPLGAAYFLPEQKALGGLLLIQGLAHHRAKQLSPGDAVLSGKAINAISGSAINVSA